MMTKVIIVILSLAYLQHQALSQIQEDDNDAELYVTLNQPKNSTLRGHHLTSFQGKKYCAFQEIPYAIPPIGERRFKAPEPMQPWKGIYNATKSEKMCTQFTERRGTTVTGEEDCLYLYVYTPLNPKKITKKLPVLFWIHGGGFVEGSGRNQTHNPTYFMDEEIVIVTINYRLGILGFLTTGDSVIPSNLGLRDQRLALEWTHANIEKFGGDPKNITIFGESAGAASVGYHLLGYAEKPLFAAAILASGTAQNIWTYQHDPRRRAFETGKSLDKHFKSDDSAALLALLQNVSAPSLLKSDLHSDTKRVAILANDKNWFRPPTDAMEKGQFAKVPMMVGFNSEEFGYPDKDACLNGANEIDKNISSILGVLDVGKHNSSEIGLRLKELYTKGLFADDLLAYVKYLSDYLFISAIVKHADSASKFVPTYLYSFSFKSSKGPRSGVPGVNGVYHAEDLSFYWKDCLFEVPESERIIAKKFVRILTNFVKYKNPMPHKDPLLENVSWPTVKPNQIKYMNFGSTFKVEENPRNYSAIDTLLKKYLVKPVIVY
ncbi:unnamed protein product [Acanthoscelides obtectus]|uniref:Carboxylic ester hydrolase n=1 Tax=Acanthoscelides obtectus TaxID=200917 RepID=A0A9P0LDU7_ACAOB|nr:unnamed protein product [Acanthoscelides obtectus]CAK1674035.1 Cholinesterase [Acanthoscelides obtectus]